MLRQDIRVEGGRIVADLDLKIANGVTGIEWTEQGNQRIDDCLTSGQFWKIQTELFVGWPKIQQAILCERRSQRIGVPMIESERESM